MSDLWIMVVIVVVMVACAIIGSKLQEGSFRQTILMFCLAMCVMVLLCVQWQV